VGDSGFEQVSYASGIYGQPAAGASPWTYSGTAGVSANASPFTSGNPNAPQGAQVAWLDQLGSFSQTISGWSAGSYTIAFDAAKRGNWGGIENFEVLVDGSVVGSFEPLTTTYQAFGTASFTVSAGSHTVEFLGINTAGGDDTDFIDAVSIQFALPANSVTLGDAGFESASVGSGSYAYDPSGSAWSFSGTVGVSGNGSALTSGNPSAPQGSQVGFVQGTGLMSQIVSGWAAGSYSISFDAAMGGGANSSNLDGFVILVDGVLVGTFEPLTTAYQAYATATFTVSTGSHLIQIAGINPLGGNATDLIDAISIN
jgi:hypothetical protein